MAKTEREAELEQRIKDLECEIASLKSNAPRRRKIVEMSAEVVDSNPYRYVASYSAHCLVQEGVTPMAIPLYIRP